jgi:hypothetical protein
LSLYFTYIGQNGLVKLFTKLFVEGKKNALSMVLFFILAVVTLGLVSLVFYDEFIERKYMVNRRRLIKAIKNGTVKVVQKPTLDPDYFSDIEMYDITYVSGEVYNLWLWTSRSDGVIKASVGGHIGLFTGSLSSRLLIDKLVKTVRAEING